MKDRALTGSEPTKVAGSCKTYYKRSCSGPTPTLVPTPVPSLTPAPTPAPPPAPTNTCYGHFTNVVVDEGVNVGHRLFTRSSNDCQAACTNEPNCKSFSLCPEYNGCWMKDRALTGSEPTKVAGSCRTFYKMVCVALTPTSPPTAVAADLPSYSDIHRSDRAGRPTVTTTAIRYYAPPPLGIVGTGHHTCLSGGILLGAVVVSLAAFS